MWSASRTPPPWTSLVERRTSETALRRQYVKLCDIRDFDNPDVRARIDDITPGVEPPTHLHCKHWEFAMLTLLLEDSGLLREDARLPSVGAGHLAR